MELNQELEKEENIDYYYNEEEEEEEDGEEHDNEENWKNDNQKNDNKEENIEQNNLEKNEKENIEKDKGKEKDKINNENNNIINKEEDKEKEKENNIIETNKKEEDTKEDSTQNTQNTENSENAKQIVEEIDTTIPKKINDNENQQNENEEKEGNRIIQSFNQNTICHRLIPKGSDLDITQKAHFKCYKIKTKANIMSFITGSKKIIVPYIIFLDENYYYMAKDKIVNQKNPNLRRIGNKYNLLKLSNFQTTKKGDDYEFAFEFVKDDIFERIFKLLYFTPKEAEEFYAVLHTILGQLNIEIPENMEGNEEEEEEEEGDEEGEEMEDDEEEGEEGEEHIEIGGNDKEKKGEENLEHEKNNKIEKNENNEKNEKNEEDIKELDNSNKEENKEVRDVEIIAK